MCVICIYELQIIGCERSYAINLDKYEWQNGECTDGGFFGMVEKFENVDREQNMKYEKYHTIRI